MTDSIDTSEREAEDPRGPFSLPIREMRDEPVPHQAADPIRAALQLALEATPEELPAALSAVRAALAAQQAGVQVPPSYKLVPVEPTKEMILAALESDRVDWIGHYNIPESIYRAMISAAPEAPAQAEQRCRHGVWAADHCYACEREPAARPTQGEAPSEREALGAWDGAEEWERLAWELCAEENGEDACNELVWEGGPTPEPWGERWLKYEDEAKRLIALVRKHVPGCAALASQPQAEAEPVAPYCYVYEYDGVFGLHREFYPREWNGRKPDRTVPVYLHPPTQASQPQAVDAELLEALREAISVCASVSMSTSRSMVCNGHTFFLQTEDWCKWLDAEVKPMLRAALAKAEKQPQAVDAENAWVALTDEDRERAFKSMPDMLDGFLKTWGWIHFAKAIEAICREKNAARRAGGAA